MRLSEIARRKQYVSKHTNFVKIEAEDGKITINSLMAIAVNSSLSSYSLLAGRNVPSHCQGCYTEETGYCPWPSSFGWKTIMCEGRRNKVGASKSTSRHSAVRGNHSFGLSDCSLVSRERKFQHIKVQVAADYSDSRSGAFEHHSKLGYHPLEELSEIENTERGELRLSYAEIARSTAEANHKAILVLPGMVHREPHQEASLIELQYVIDDYGDIYFEMNGDENILRSPRAKNPVNVFVGLDELQINGEQKRIAFENYNNIHTYASSDTNNKDAYEEDWSSIAYGGDNSEHSESINDWAKLDTMAMVHPLYFAKKIVNVVSTNQSEKMDRPSHGLAIIGFLRPALMEEQAYLETFLYGKDYSSGDDNYTEEDDQFGNENGEPNQSVFESENMADSGYVDETDSGLSNDDPDSTSMIESEDEEYSTLESESDGDSFTSSLYKLEILRIQLISVYGNQPTVTLQDFQQAEPDILAHSSSEIIAHFNTGSKKTKRALKALCWKKKGLDVEGAFLVGVDSLGVDIRVQCGAEVQTVRIAFNSQVTTEDAAKKQIQR
ncbi:hypothetical protein KI387_013679, partial [Taxus chinensis]